MPFEATLDLLTLRRDGVDASHWPRLSCSQAQQAALAGSDLRLDAGREVLFQDQGQIRAFDDTHRLVFNRAGSLLELHEQGAIRFLTGAPTPSERLRILATGQVGLGTPTPTQALDVVGTVKATAFAGNGAALTGVRGTDATKVAKSGDTMTGTLALTAAGTGLNVANNANVGGTLTVAGNLGLGTTAPAQKLEVVGTVKATAFQGNGAGLTGVSGTDATKVAKAGDTMTGPLALTAAGTGLNVTNNANVGGTLTVTGNLGLGTTQASQKLTLGSGNILLPNANAGIHGNLYFGGITDAGQTGLRVFGGLVNGTDPAGFIDVRTTNPNDGLRIRVDTANGGIERMRVTAGGNVGIGTSGPVYKLDVADRIRLRDGPSGSAGLWLFRSGRNVDRAFVGMANDDVVGLYGHGGGGWALTVDVNNSTVYIGNNKTGPFVRFNDDLWFSDPQNGTIHTRNFNNTNFGTMVGFFQPPSSREFKKEIRVLQAIDLEQLLAHTLHTDLVHFRYKSDDASHRMHLGVIAEDAPDVMVGKDGQSIAISEYVAMLHGAIKALASRFADLRTTEEHLNANC